MSMFLLIQHFITLSSKLPPIFRSKRLSEGPRVLDLLDRSVLNVSHPNLLQPNPKPI
jgi:hypothetical protein